jgi:3-deoxy-D-manno-octulosonate 8-phosphate phosphatase (KDO 8-P phosphatase)
MNSKQRKICFDDIKVFIFDFDGVLTDNLVYLNQHRDEWVSCSRADGLAFDVLHKLKKRVYILSTEKNPVVAARANKLKVPVLQGIGDKVQTLRGLMDKKGFELENVL